MYAPFVFCLFMFAFYWARLLLFKNVKQILLALCRDMVFPHVIKVHIWIRCNLTTVYLLRTASAFTKIPDVPEQVLQNWIIKLWNNRAREKRTEAGKICEEQTNGNVLSRCFRVKLPNRWLLINACMHLNASCQVHFRASFRKYTTWKL